MAYPPYPSGDYAGYVPRDLLETYRANKSLYAELGKPAPVHYFTYDGVTYKVSYDSPSSATAIGSTTYQQVSDAEGTTSPGLVIDDPAKSNEPPRTTRVTPTPEPTLGITVTAPPTGSAVVQGDASVGVLAAGMGLLILLGLVLSKK
jgi:hypothetical protein